MKVIIQKDENYPKRLLQIQNPPKKLYVEGNEKLLNQDAIAIVGTRNCTKYGEKCASKFARELSKKGICKFASTFFTIFSTISFSFLLHGIHMCSGINASG